MPGEAVLPRRPGLILATVFILLTAAYSLAWMYGVRWRPTSRIGIEFVLTDSTPHITVVEPGGPADRAGLQPGDIILAVEDQPITGTSALAHAAGRRTPGTWLEVTIERAGAGRMTLPVQVEAPRDTPASTPPLVNRILEFYPVGFLVVAAFVLIQRPQDRHAWLLAIMFAAFIAGAPIRDEPLRPPLDRMVLVWRTIFYAVGPAIFYIFFATFPTRSPLDARAPWLKWVFLATGLVVMALLWAEIRADPRMLDQFQALVIPTGRWLLGAYAMAAYGAGGVSLLWNNVRAPSPEARRRTRVIVWGTVAGFAPIFTLQLIAGGRSIYEAFPAWLWTASVLLLFLLPLSFAYAVVRHRVLEVPLLLKRSARYLLVQRGFVLLLVLVSAALTVGLASTLARLLPGDVELAVVWGLLAGVGLMWSGTRVERRITERLDRAFFRGAYDARHLLEELANQAVRATDRQELAGLLERSLTGALHPTRLLVYLARGGSLELAGSTVVPEIERMDPSLPDLADLARGGEPVVLPPPLDPTTPPSALARLGAECLVPLSGRTRELLGLICLGARRSEEPYSGEDRRLLAAVSRQAGLALENITLAERIAERLEAERRAQREMDIARQVQRKLFPQKFPALSTITYAGACLQARAVGGDYYDFLDFGPGSIGFVLADISGKGIHAALLMASLQANLRGQYAIARNDLSALLESVDRLFFESTAPNHFATMFFARYDDASRRLMYANCGHNPPLLARAGGNVEWLDPTTSVLGLFDVWRCRVAEVEIGPGDTLVLYTDGVTEALSDEGEEFGEGRLVDVVQRHRDFEPASLLTAIMTSVHEFSGVIQEDDVTMVAIRGR